MKHEPIEGRPFRNRALRYQTVAVVRAGSWGTATATTLARSGTSTRLWDRSLGAFHPHRTKGANLIFDHPASGQSIQNLAERTL
ncbi:hypothetical protein AB2B41_16940 [Marimonas sp. MJW-29]|uniref:Glycerol-3-phosphate dehydrogenase NAD-dependent N-terminal domain-containing protein n=1 Tax=Sulfitobacter sediminis TaxID=3234186 RepID=A0ABV3RQZ1_9RHOB